MKEDHIDIKARHLGSKQTVYIQFKQPLNKATSIQPRPSTGTTPLHVPIEEQVGLFSEPVVEIELLPISTQCEGDTGESPSRPTLHHL